jgi:hypothetical protein
VARVLKALLNLALQYVEVRPSLLGIARLAAPASRPWSTASSSCRSRSMAVGPDRHGGPSLSVNSTRAFVPNRSPTLSLTEYVERPDS